MNKADFEKLVGRIFEIKIDGDVVDHCRLEKIYDYPYSGLPGAKKEPFGLDFASKKNDRYPKYIVTASTEGFAEFTMNLIPSWKDSEGILYHAVFA